VISMFPITTGRAALKPGICRFDTGFRVKHQQNRGFEVETRVGRAPHGAALHTAGSTTALGNARGNCPAFANARRIPAAGKWTTVPSRMPNRFASDAGHRLTDGAGRAAASRGSTSLLHGCPRVQDEVPALGGVLYWPLRRT
jgi:hypothetical protein